MITLCFGLSLHAPRDPRYTGVATGTPEQVPIHVCVRTRSSGACRMATAVAAASRPRGRVPRSGRFIPQPPRELKQGLPGRRLLQLCRVAGAPAIANGLESAHPPQPDANALYPEPDIIMRSHPNPMTVFIKSAAEIENMRVAGRLAAEVLEMIAPHVQPGVTTGELDRICHDYIIKVQQARFRHRSTTTASPKSICTSVNHVVCHGIPIGQAHAEERRHRQYRRHRDQGRLPRRHQQDVPGRQGRAACRAPGAHHAGVPLPGHRGGAARRTPGRHRPRDPAARREQLLLRGARVLRPRHRQRSSTRSPRCCITAAPAPAWNCSRA